MRRYSAAVRSSRRARSTLSLSLRLSPLVFSLVGSLRLSLRCSPPWGRAACVVVAWCASSWGDVAPPKPAAPDSPIRALPPIATRHLVCVCETSREAHTSVLPPTLLREKRNRLLDQRERSEFLR